MKAEKGVRLSVGGPLGIGVGGERIENRADYLVHSLETFSSGFKNIPGASKIKVKLPVNILGTTIPYRKIKLYRIKISPDLDVFDARIQLRVEKQQPLDDLPVRLLTITEFLIVGTGVQRTSRTTDQLKCYLISY